MNKEQALKNVIENPMNAEAWRILGKACGWIDKDYPNGEMKCDRKYGCESVYCSYAGYKDPIEVAKTFHEINLTQSWDKAVAWLEALVDIRDSE